MVNRALIEDILPTATITSVAHYTRIGTLGHFIPEGTSGWGSAWATPVQFLNDRMELSLGLDVLREVANRSPYPTRVKVLINYLLATSGRMETDGFQMSFSGNPDELGQWRGYAANGMGCSIVTDAEAVRNVADVAGWIIYDARKQKTFAQKVLARLREETDNALIERTLIAAASFMKHEGFRPEMEFRLLKFPALHDVKFRESGDRLVPYVDFLKGAPPLPVRRVIIGPGWQLSRLGSEELSRNHVVQGIDRLLNARGLHNVSIESSTIPYDPK
jgi:hypothetical protein